VLGYSARRSDGLHAVCAARLHHAEQLPDGADTVLLSGWARRRNGAGEAELMRTAWNGTDVRLISDATARNEGERRTSRRDRPAPRRERDRRRHVTLARLPGANARPREPAGTMRSGANVLTCRPRRPRALARELVCLAALPFHLLCLRR
jgi:hypothetical protein